MTWVLIITTTNVRSKWSPHDRWWANDGIFIQDDEVDHTLETMTTHEPRQKFRELLLSCEEGVSFVRPPHDTRKGAVNTAQQVSTYHTLVRVPFDFCVVFRMNGDSNFPR